MRTTRISVVFMRKIFTTLALCLSLIVLTTSCGSKHKAVDLGLSVKWATCNVGATTPSECGNYYSWGELDTKYGIENYTLWGGYRFGEYRNFTKYCYDSYYGTVDNKETLEPDDDVANDIWGGDWRMPTRSEIQELIDKCSWEWVHQGDQIGYTVTGPNGNSIFLPVVGCKDDKANDGFAGNYWSSSLSMEDSPVYAYRLHFNKFGIDCGEKQRINGLAVRPVRP